MHVLYVHTHHTQTDTQANLVGIHHFVRIPPPPSAVEVFHMENNVCVCVCVCVGVRVCEREFPQ